MPCCRPGRKGKVLRAAIERVAWAHLRFGHCRCMTLADAILHSFLDSPTSMRYAASGRIKDVIPDSRAIS